MNREFRFIVSCICGSLVCVSDRAQFEHSVFSSDDGFMELPGSSMDCENCKNIIKFLVTKEIENNGVDYNFFLKEIL